MAAAHPTTFFLGSSSSLTSCQNGRSSWRMGILLEKMTPGGKVGRRACCRCVGMADDAKHIKRRPVARYPGYQRLLPGSPRGAGAEGKKKGRLPDGSGPQQFEPRGGSGLLLRVSPRGSRALWSNKGRQHHADGPPAGEAQQGKLPAGNLEAVAPMATARPRRRKNSLVQHRHIAAPVPATTDGHFQNGKYRVLWSLPVRGVIKKAPRFRGA